MPQSRSICVPLAHPAFARRCEAFSRYELDRTRPGRVWASRGREAILFYFYDFGLGFGWERNIRLGDNAPVGETSAAPFHAQADGSLAANGHSDTHKRRGRLAGSDGHDHVLIRCEHVVPLRRQGDADKFDFRC